MNGVARLLKETTTVIFDFNGLFYSTREREKEREGGRGGVSNWLLKPSQPRRSYWGETHYINMKHFTVKKNQTTKFQQTHSVQI